jgi:Arc/MetJ-type ribon-helix-helix transcriptional regulator
MSGDGAPKKTIRGSPELWRKYDEFIENSDYDNRSEGVRDAIRIQMDSDKTLLEEDFYKVFDTYASGLADGNPVVAGVGLDMLYELDKKLGELAERELDKIE